MAYVIPGPLPRGALDWDITNRDHPRVFEATREEKISNGRVDYGFRVGGVIRFYLEAKSFREGVEQLCSGFVEVLCVGSISQFRDKSAR